MHVQRVSKSILQNKKGDFNHQVEQCLLCNLGTQTIPSSKQTIVAVRLSICTLCQHLFGSDSRKSLKIYSIYSIQVL